MPATDASLLDDLRRIREDPQIDAAGPFAQHVIEAAEFALGLRFPDDYRAFVGAVGNAGIGSTEIFGIVNEDVRSGLVPNAVGLTLHARSEWNLDANYILIGTRGDGGWIALHTSDTGNARVVELSVDFHKTATVAPDFATYLHAVLAP